LDQKYNVLAPIELGPIPAMHTPMASLVQVDPVPANGDIYEIVAGQGKFAYSKALLDRIAAAAGISWLPEVCGRADAGTDPEVVRFRMGAKRKELDGQWRVVVREYEFDLRARQKELEDTVPKRKWITDIADLTKRQRAITEAVDKDMVQLRKHKVGRAESGAANRVVRVFLGIKSGYTKEQIAKPVVVPKLVFTPDYSDPEIRRFMLAEATGTISELYGAQAQAGSFARPVVVVEDEREIEEERTALHPAPSGDGDDAGKASDSTVQDAETEPPDDAGKAPSAVREAAAADQPPPDPDEVRFQEAAGDAKKEGEALTSLMARKAYRTERLKKALGEFSKEERRGFLKHLLGLPEATKQAPLPWH